LREGRAVTEEARLLVIREAINDAYLTKIEAEGEIMRLLRKMHDEFPDEFQKELARLNSLD